MRRALVSLALAALAVGGCASTASARFVARGLPVRDFAMRADRCSDTVVTHEGVAMPGVEFWSEDLPGALVVVAAPRQASTEILSSNPAGLVMLYRITGSDTPPRITIPAAQCTTFDLQYAPGHPVEIVRRGSTRYLIPANSVYAELRCHAPEGGEFVGTVVWSDCRQ